jgi:hypothetical protein
VSQKVARHEVPHRIMVVDSIPLTTAGKADRGALSDLLRNYSKLSPVAKLRSKKKGLGLGLKAFLRQQFLQTFDSDDDVIPMRNITSLAMISFMEKMSSVYGIELSLKDMYSGFSIGDLVKKIPPNLDNQSRKVLDTGPTQENPPEEEKDSKIPVGLPWAIVGKSTIARFGNEKKQLVLVPGLFGRATGYHFWLSQEDRNFGAIVTEQRGNLGKTPRMLAEEFCEMIGLSYFAAVPCICGFSSGGIVALEMAKFVKERTGRCLKVVLLDTYIDRKDGRDLDIEGLVRYWLKDGNKFADLQGGGIACSPEVPFDICCSVLDAVALKHGATAQNLRDFWEVMHDGSVNLETKAYRIWSPDADLTNDVLLADNVLLVTARNDPVPSQVQENVDKWKTFLPGISIIDFPLEHEELPRNLEVYKILKRLMDEAPSQ